MSPDHTNRLSPGRRIGFTLIELLVVIGVMSILMTILVPALGRARDQARAVKCSMNLRSVGAGLATYLADSQYYPPSYVYPTNDVGNWDSSRQDVNHPNGYLHWSHFIYGTSGVEPKAFECPSFRNGGAPRTNPGADPGDWESGQVDQNGNSSSNPLVDRQAPRIAYTANAAIMPRNKFTQLMSGAQRVNQLVKSGSIEMAEDTIVITEFLNDWKGVAVAQGGALLSKSHRPLTPFTHVGTGFAGYAAYRAPYNTPGFLCANPGEPHYGIRPYYDVLGQRDLLSGDFGYHPLNAVGRHHPGAGEDPAFGQAGNFLYADGHVERKHVIETIEQRQWGQAFYSITGNNKVKYINR